PVCEQKKILFNLQVMGTRKISAGEKADRLQPARIRGVEDRHSIAEHVADIKVGAIQHDLHAVWAPADIAVRQMAEPMPDSLRRYLSFFYRGRLPGSVRGRCETKQAFHITAAIDG